MNDNISRRAVMDFVGSMEMCDQITADAYKDLICYLEDLPSEQPEVIRCKDCRHRDAETGFCEGRGWPMQLVPDDGFCDKGERSEE